MSNGKSRRSLWQVLGLYFAGSWVCLQVVDVLGQNIRLPSWAFLLTLVLLLIGLPITAATAYLQSRSHDKGDRRGLEHRLLTWRNVVTCAVGAMAVWGVAVTGWLVIGGDEPSEGEVLAEVEEIERLVAGSDFTEAYARVSDLDRRIRDDSLREDLWARVSLPLEIGSDPLGALVSRRDYAPADAAWEELGTTPLRVDRFPLGQSRIRFELEGHRTREIAAGAADLAEVGPVDLYPEDAVPEGMVSVLGRSGSDAYGLFAPGLEQAPNVTVGEFLMGVYEVTNREYAEFVRAGGYSEPACWEHPFVEDGRVLSFEEARARFVDATGRPGPSTWDAGTYPIGTEDFPVGGVSWYEAAAYACYAGMALPTVYHWYAAANPFSSHHVVPLSNYGGGPAAVGQFQGVSQDGVYDLAGNVREWTRNATGESRYILGGGWADLQYSFNDAVTAPAFDRSPLNGIRLVRYTDTTNVAAASAELPLAFRDYRAERPVSDDVFEVYRQAYAYDDVPLNARLVSADTTDLWIRERIDMDAGYGGETLTTFVFLPRGVEAPLQTIVYFPGSNVIYRRSYDELSIAHIDFLLRGGRALVFPVYRGTFGRETDLRSDIQDESNHWRDYVIAWTKDLRRSIDYLATRSDVDTDRLAYLGVSWGGAVAPVMVALEDRLRAVVIIVGGLLMQDTQPMADPFHFLPRVRQPTVMINARFDSFYPLETSGRPFFDNLGTPDDRKRLVIIDANHGVFSYARDRVVGETLDWLDEYLGPVR
jgi:formylglycine-generating enzyme required for sulfatase activity/dienelactone hydrolase